MDSDREPSRDRISSLPDGVLCHILSYLDTTKCIIRTSILSRRWRHLWASVPNLYFFEENLQSSKYGKDLERTISFINFVNRALVFNNLFSIKKFHLGCGDHCKTCVHTWICAVIERNVQDLHLYLYMEQPVQLPRMLFSCKTLVSLKLSKRIALDVPISVYLPSLKTLHLNWIAYMKNDTIQKLLCGCPVLENLIIQRRGENTSWDFIVSSPTLKNLIIDFSCHHFNDNREYKLVVNAPNLGYLKLSDSVSEACMVDYLLVNLSSLSKVYIDIVLRDPISLEESKFYDALYKLLCGISNVKFLSLSEETLYSLGNMDDCKLPTFYNMTHLTLGDFGWLMLPDFLESSPNLQVLILLKECLDMDEPEDWTPPKHVPACFALHLMEIEIRKFRAEEYKLDAIRYMLGNTKVLKKMTINCRGLNLRRESQIYHELTRFPRGSSRCQLNLLF